MMGWWKRFLSFVRPVSSPRRCPFSPDLLAGDSVTLYAALAAHWCETEGRDYVPAHDMAAIDALETRYTIRIPADFRAYLAHAAPRETFMDDYGVQWWSIKAIQSLRDECPDGSPEQELPAIMADHGSYLIFADYLMWCSAWAICCAAGPNYGRVVFIGGRPDGFVAADFRKFVERALADSIELHRPSPH